MALLIPLRGTVLATWNNKEYFLQASSFNPLAGNSTCNSALLVSLTVAVAGVSIPLRGTVLATLSASAIVLAVSVVSAVSIPLRGTVLATNSQPTVDEECFEFQSPCGEQYLQPLTTVKETSNLRTVSFNPLAGNSTCNPPRIYFASLFAPETRAKALKSLQSKSCNH